MVCDHKIQQALAVLELSRGQAQVTPESLNGLQGGGGGYEQEPVSIRGRRNGVEGECIARSKPVRGTELEHTSLLQLVIGNQGYTFCAVRSAAARAPDMCPGSLHCTPHTL